jgi:hypothetical protein
MFLDLPYKDDNSIFNKIEEDYPNNFENIMAKYKDLISKKDSIRELFNYNFCSDFQSKIRYICDILKVNSNLQNLILKLIDWNISKYFIVLGPERVRASSFRKDRLDKEYNSIINNQSIDLKDNITKLFKVGQKYSKAYIKEELKKLYLSLNYKKSPKATDLEDYFIIKLVNYMENGKKTNGFEILSLK